MLRSHSSEEKSLKYHISLDRVQCVGKLINYNQMRLDTKICHCILFDVKHFDCRPSLNILIASLRQFICIHWIYFTLLQIAIFHSECSSSLTLHRWYSHLSAANGMRMNFFDSHKLNEINGLHWLVTR